MSRILEVNHSEMSEQPVHHIIASQISMNLIRLVSVLDIFSAITKRFIRFSQHYQLFLFPLKI